MLCFSTYQALSTHTGGMILVMKKILLTLLMVAMAASSSFAEVQNSVHDLSVGSPFSATTEIRICAFCHTPHHANVVGDYMPLWSHELSAIASFTPYDSATINGDTSDPMRGGSLLCMSCHDGAVAPDAYYGTPGGAVAPGTDVYNDFGIGAAGLMNNDHPIGMSYNASRTGNNDIQTAAGIGAGDAYLRDPNIPLSNHDGGFSPLSKAGVYTFDSTQYSVTSISEVLASDGVDDDIVACSSCHDVHNGDQTFQEASVVTPTGQVGATKSLLYGSQVDSAFCIMCHIK